MLERYNIEDAHVSFLQEVDNLLYRVVSPTHGQFLLRMHQVSRHSEAELHSELLWLAALRHEGQLPVPEPIRTRDGSLICEVASSDVPEPRRCVLLRWIPGKRKRASLRPEDAKPMGSYMARLHEYAERWTPPPEFLRSNGRYINCANRCYYACFQAAITALIRSGIQPGGPQWSHTFVPAQFNGQLINRRKLYSSALSGCP